MSEAELRAKLRPIFDRFDLDGSGSVSTDEMGKMVRALKMDMSPEQLDQLMKDADPDGSGEIDFDEFVVVLRQQLKDGHGGLGSVFTGASSLLGFLNPFSWFAPAAAEPPAPAPVKERPRRKSVHDRLYATPTAATPSKALYVRRDSVASADALRELPGMPLLGLGDYDEPLSPGRISQIQYAQWVVQAGNKASGDELQQNREEWLAFKRRKEDRFKATQQERITAIRHERAVAKQNVEAVKQARVVESLQMRAQLDHAWEVEKWRKAKYAQKSRTRALLWRSGRNSKQKQQDREQKAAVAAVTKMGVDDRHKRREEAKQSHQAVAEVVRQKTERVRFETRPEVRAEGREMFQAQRDAVAAQARLVHMENQQRIAMHDDLWHDRMEEKRQVVRHAEEMGKNARSRLAEVRKVPRAAVTR